MPQVEAYLPIGEYFIYPDIFLDMNLVDTERIANDNSLVVLPSAAVLEIARATLPELTDRNIKDIRDVNPELKRDDIIRDFRHLHKFLWKEQRWVRPKEVRAYLERRFPEHPSINSDPSISRKDVVQIILADYKISDGEKPFDINGMKKDPRIVISSTAQMIRQLGMSKYPKIIGTQNSFDDGGIRTFYWEFVENRPYQPNLHCEQSYKEKVPYGGSILGKRINSI